MELKQYLDYRKDLLNDSRDENGFISEAAFIDSAVIPLMEDAKLIDSADWQETFYRFDVEKIKLNGYLINESGERLQLLILDEDSVGLAATDEDLSISLKSYYEAQFGRALKFVKKAINRSLEDTQDSSPANLLIHQLSSSEMSDQFDVIEIFLISATATMEMRGNEPKPKKFEFEREEIKVSFTIENQTVKKKMMIIKRLIDLNFLYEVMVSQGNREILTIDFEQIFGTPITAIKAANENHFESYLCVIPATSLVELYRLYSTRLLEKNVRSFLDYKNDANRGMLATMKKDPSKFIAFNNGLTITSTGADTVQENGTTLIRSLTDFQIVNGGQTTAAIYFGRKSNVDVSKVYVTAKINVVKLGTEMELNTFIKEISLYSNTQNKVTTVDLDSQNPQLLKLKAMTMSVVTPSGKKWFFDRARGEYSTMLKKSGKNRSRLEKDFENRRFSKEDLGKYYTAWGNQPHLVKRGGIKVFKFFITAICGDGDKHKPLEIDRTFYEELIAKVILFDRLVKIHGTGKKAIGQLRSAVIPYTISVLYMYTDGAKKGITFDLSKIWKAEDLESDLAAFLEDLMSLNNQLIKTYADSDDYGENSKKQDLWERVLHSKELIDFMEQKPSLQILAKYSVSNDDKKKLAKKNKKTVDFKYLSDNVTIYNNGLAYYDRILVGLNDRLSANELDKLGTIKSAIAKKEDIPQKYVDFEQELTRLIVNERPEIFQSNSEPDIQIWKDSFDFVLRIYNNTLEHGGDVQSEFNKVENFAKLKGIKFYSVFNQIGSELSKGKLPTMKQLWCVSHILPLKSISQSL